MPADRPAPDPSKLLDQWMEWEIGDAAPGQTLANLKKGGIRDLLEAIVAQAAEVQASAESGAEPA